MIKLTFDGSSVESLHTQLAEAVSQAVEEGRLRPGDRLPSEVELAAELEVTAYAVSRGYADLAERGVVVQQRGRGTHVAPGAPKALGLRDAAKLRRIVLVTGVGDLGVIHSATRFMSLEVIAGVSAAARAANVELRLDPGLPKALPKGPEDGEGILVMGARGFSFGAVDREWGTEVLCRRIPVVVIADNSPWPVFPSVSYRRYDAGRLATEHLVECGYREIGFVGECDASVYGARMKFVGYVDVMRESGLDIRARHLARAGLVPGGAYQAAEQMIEAGPPPEAIFADTDYKAMEVVWALRSRGLSVPDDVAVIGYDGIPEAHEFDPPLTTVAIDRKEIGRRAAKLLLEWPEAGDMPDSVAVRPELRLGKTTGSRQAP